MTPKDIALLRESQYADAMAKAALLCKEADRMDLHDAIRGLAKTYGMVPISKPDVVLAANQVARAVIDIMRRFPGQPFRPGDLRIEIAPMPSLSVWQDALKIVVDHPNVDATGAGDYRRYTWSYRAKPATVAS